MSTLDLNERAAILKSLQFRGNRQLFHEAASGGDVVALARALMLPGVSVDVPGHDKETPLQRACIKGHLEVVNWLLSRGANINHRNVEGASALHLAAECAEGDILKTLIKNGADLLIKDDHGWLFSHSLACYHRHDLLHLLIDHQMDVNVPTENGWTPLHFGVYSKHLQTVEWLIEHGADVDAKNNDGETPEELAHRLMMPQIESYLKNVALAQKEQMDLESTIGAGSMETKEKHQAASCVQQKTSIRL